MKKTNTKNIREALRKYIAFFFDLIFSYLFLIGVFLMACTIAGLTILFTMFDINNDTTSITNYGFAILIAIASVCFSWSRVFNSKNEKDQQLVGIVINAGEQSFLSAIFFICASGFKYSFLHMDEVFKVFDEKHLSNAMFKILTKWGSYITFSLAYFLFMFAIINILTVLKDRSILGATTEEDAQAFLEYERAKAALKEN